MHDFELSVRILSGMSGMSGLNKNPSASEMSGLELPAALKDRGRTLARSLISPSIVGAGCLLVHCEHSFPKLR
jgi:hypothetical protein